MADSEIARRVRAARIYGGLSRRDLARRLEVSEGTLINTELGKRHAPRPELLAIAEACDVPMWFLERGWDGWRSETSVDDLGRQALEDLDAEERREAG